MCKYRFNLQYDDLSGIVNVENISNFETSKENTKTTTTTTFHIYNLLQAVHSKLLLHIYKNDLHMHF